MRIEDPIREGWIARGGGGYMEATESATLLYGIAFIVDTLSGFQILLLKIIESFTWSI